MCYYTLILIRLYSLFTENLKIVMGIWTGIRFLQKCDRGNLFDRKQFIEGLLNEEIQWQLSWMGNLLNKVSSQELLFQ